MEIDPEIKKLLDMKYASGEITEEEYKKRLAIIHQTNTKIEKVRIIEEFDDFIEEAPDLKNNTVQNQENVYEEKEKKRPAGSLSRISRFHNFFYQTEDPEYYDIEMDRIKVERGCAPLIVCPVIGLLIGIGATREHPFNINDVSSWSSFTCISVLGGGILGVLLGLGICGIVGSISGLFIVIYLFVVTELDSSDYYRENRMRIALISLIVGAIAGAYIGRVIRVYIKNTFKIEKGWMWSVLKML